MKRYGSPGTKSALLAVFDAVTERRDGFNAQTVLEQAENGDVVGMVAPYVGAPTAWLLEKVDDALRPSPESAVRVDTKLKAPDRLKAPSKAATTNTSILQTVPNSRDSGSMELDVNGTLSPSSALDTATPSTPDAAGGGASPQTGSPSLSAPETAKQDSVPAPSAISAGSGSGGDSGVTTPVGTGEGAGSVNPSTIDSGGSSSVGTKGDGVGVGSKDGTGGGKAEGSGGVSERGDGTVGNGGKGTDDRSLMGGENGLQHKDEPGSGDECTGSCGKGGLSNPYDDNGSGIGVGGDRARVMIDSNGGLFKELGNLLDLFSSRQAIDVFGLFSSRRSNGDIESSGQGPSSAAAFLAALNGVLNGQLVPESRTSTTKLGVMNVIDLVTDWGDSGGVDDGDVSGPKGPPSRDADLVANETDHETGQPVGPPTPGGNKGKATGHGQRTLSRHLAATVGGKALRTNGGTKVSTHHRWTVQKSVRVTSQTQQLSTSPTPTAVGNYGPSARNQSPLTKLESPSNTTSRIQSPSSQVGYSE